ncbi:MAG: molecular chaperone TorD family protein, partial [bacterium]|nr:molecular chaperone TorD family protein [bacterium]
MEVFRALGALCEPPGPQTATLAEALGLTTPIPTEADHTDLFLFQLYPYASVYLGPEGQLGGPARDRVAGFWRALGLTPPAEPDHLAALLGLLAALAGAERAEVDAARRVLRSRARAALLTEHLLSWLPPYLARVQELGGNFYVGWARLLGTALEEEAARLHLPDR